MPPIRIGNAGFNWGERTYIMGIINLSADSFSGDGLGDDVEAAIARAKRFVEEGADIIDVGGESTRPGTEPDADNVDRELELVIPVIERLAGEIPLPISVDTYKSPVARRAVEAGAGMINDIWGLKRDPALAGIAADSGVPLVLMSNQRDDPPNDNIMGRVIADLEAGINIALKAGVPRENIIVDPGAGFGKTLEQNLEIVRRLAELKTLQRPILLGTSRKSMIGLVLDLPVDQRLEGTAATVALGIASGADIVRVHDVRQMACVCRMSDAIVRGRADGQ